MSFGSLNSYILRIEYVHIGVYIFLFSLFFYIQKLQRLSTSFKKRGDAREFKIIFFAVFSSTDLEFGTTVARSFLFGN